MPEAVSTFLPLIAIFGLFWLLFIRPTQKRNKALAQMRSAIEPGDRVMLTSGIYGTVSAVDGARAHVEIADGVVIEVAAAAIASKEEGHRPSDALTPEEPEESEAPADVQRDVRPDEER